MIYIASIYAKSQCIYHTYTESILFIAGLLAEKTDIENTTSPEGRKFALAQLQKIMFGKDSPYVKFDDKVKEAPIVKVPNLPPKGTANREWLDTGTNKLAGPTALSKTGREPKVGANPYMHPPNEPYSHHGTPEPPNYSNGGINEEMEDYGFEPPEKDYAGNINNPRYYNPNVSDPGKNKRRKGKKNDVTLKWAGKG